MEPVIESDEKVDFSRLGTETFHRIELLVNGFVLSAVSVIGLAGNIGMLLVLSKFRSFCRQEKPYLIALALCDMALLSSAWLFFSHSTLTAHEYIVHDNQHHLAYIFIVTYFVANFCFAAHIWLTVSLSVERCMAICHPIWHKTMKPRRLALILIIVALAISTAHATPKLFEIYLHKAENETQVLTTELVAAYSYAVGYKLIGQIIMTSIGPLVVLTVLTVRMLYAIKRSVAMIETVDMPSLPRPRCFSEGLRSTETTLIRSRGSSKSSKSSGSSVRSERNDFFSRRRTFGLISIARQQRIQHTRQGSKVLRCNRRRKRSSLAVSEGNARKPLIALLLSTILAYSIPTMVDLLETIGTDSEIKDYATLVGNLSILLNAASTFFVYLLRSHQLRQLLMSVCWQRRRSQIPEISLVRVRASSQAMRAQSVSYNVLTVNEQSIRRAS